MRRTLADARSAFVTAVRRDTPGTDLPRLVKVLDALIAWSVARSEQLTFKADEGRADVLSFARAGTAVVFWSAQVTRGAGPKLEIYPPAGRALGAEDRALVLETLNAHARPALADDARLRISFGALKNDAARGAVLTLLKRLLAVSEELTSTSTSPSQAMAARETSRS